MPAADVTQNLIPVHRTDAELHVASVVVHCRPTALAEISDWLLSQAGVEIHAQSAQGKLVVVMETYKAQDILDLIDRAHEHTGVANAALIYHEMVAPEAESEESLES